ncbi:hypothetical protein NDU88_001184 [Pleurodeles waltl]|uniref:Uncharacterized protein n=1 Tax=Pleurodeles waltl TaxID=8319 RepID=A0AAV7KPL0_PLEWA|nr:hypothetical protein NDU88_001184 [Pleurodeles waltl]
MLASVYSAFNQALSNLSSCFPSPSFGIHPLPGGFTADLAVLPPAWRCYRRPGGFIACLVEFSPEVIAGLAVLPPAWRCYRRPGGFIACLVEFSPEDSSPAWRCYRRPGGVIGDLAVLSATWRCCLPGGFTPCWRAHRLPGAFHLPVPGCMNMQG